MISQQCQSTYSTIPNIKYNNWLWRSLKHLWLRYSQWRRMKQQHWYLLRMDDRLLKDIGLSRADVSRFVREDKFWRHMFRPEECDSGRLGNGGRC